MENKTNVKSLVRVDSFTAALMQTVKRQLLVIWNVHLGTRAKGQWLEDSRNDFPGGIGWSPTALGLPGPPCYDL